MTSESDHPHTNNEEFGISHLTTVQMEVDVETVTEMQGDASLDAGHNQEGTSSAQEGDIHA